MRLALRSRCPRALGKRRATAARARPSHAARSPAEWRGLPVILWPEEAKFRAGQGSPCPRTDVWKRSSQRAQLCGGLWTQPGQRQGAHCVCDQGRALEIDPRGSAGLLHSRVPRRKPMPPPPRHTHTGFGSLRRLMLTTRTYLSCVRFTSQG